MNKKNKTKLLSGMLMASVMLIGFGGLSIGAKRAMAKLPVPSSVFSVSDSAFAKIVQDETDKTKTAFVLENNGGVIFKRDLAIKWFDKVEETVTEKYFSTRFSFQDKNFVSLTFTFEGAPASANEDDKSVNKLVFSLNDGAFQAKVNDGEDKALSVEVGEAVNVTFANGSGHGKLKVSVNGTEIGEFDDIGENYFDYISGSRNPMRIDAVVEGDEDASTTIYFEELNGQSFELNEETGKIKEDNAYPVLVVNEDLSHFTQGTAYSLDYAIIDVIDSSPSSDVRFYQYNPTTDTTSDPEKKAIEYYKSLSTSNYFSTTAYTYNDGSKDVSTTVESENEGTEFVSVIYRLYDDSHSEKKNYELAWYVDASAIIHPTEAIGGYSENLLTSVDYLPLIYDKKEEPKYVEGFDVAAYQALVNIAAEKAEAGSGNYINLPSPVGMFSDDDTGLKALKFSIYYKSPKSSSGTSSTSLSYNALKFVVSSSGDYEFRIAATDKSGNISKAKDKDGEWQTVSSTNVWDLDIPTYTFNVKAVGLSVTDDSQNDRLSKAGYVGVKYSDFSGFKTKGDVGNKAYALYYFDITKYNADHTEATLSSIDLISKVVYSDLAIRINPGDDNDLAKLIADLYFENCGYDLSDYIHKIDEYDGNFSKDVCPDNVYEWSSSAHTFIPNQTGAYLIFAGFQHSEKLAEVAGAYELVMVQAKEDTLKGDDNWFERNKVSVIFFALAGVMLILIIVLLFVKPSEEKLEDLDDDAKDDKDTDKGKTDGDSLDD